MTLTVTDRRLEAGDTVRLGDVQDSHTSHGRGGGLRLIAAWEGEATEYVVLRFHAGNGEEIEADGQVLALDAGRGMSNPTVWMLIPTEEYDE